MASKTNMSFTYPLLRRLLLQHACNLSKDLLLGFELLQEGYQLIFALLQRASALNKQHHCTAHLCTHNLQQVISRSIFSELEAYLYDLLDLVSQEIYFSLAVVNAMLT